MNHRIYRNLESRDTFLGLDLIDILIMAGTLNVVFRLHHANTVTDAFMNLAIVISVYVILAFFKRKLPKGFINNLMNFLLKPRIYLPTRDKLLAPLRMVRQL